MRAHRRLKHAQHLFIISVGPAALMPNISSPAIRKVLMLIAYCADFQQSAALALAMIDDAIFAAT